jgi:hypothetical protein
MILTDDDGSSDACVCSWALLFMLPLFSGINDVIQMRQIEKDATILTQRASHWFDQ